MIAVNAPANVINFLIGSGSLEPNSKTLFNTFTNLVAIFRNESPVLANSALRVSTALLYLPAADSVTAANSRPATASNSPALAFIKSKT